MATHVHRDSAAGALDVAELSSVRSVVLFQLLEQRGASWRARIEQLFQAHVFWREAQLFSIHQLHVVLAAGGDHPVGLGEVQTKRLFDHRVFAGRRGGQHRLAVQMIGHAADDHLDLWAGEQLAVDDERMSNVEARGEGVGIAGCGRRYGGEVCLCAVLQRFRVDRGNTLGTDEADFDGSFHGSVGGAGDF